MNKLYFLFLILFFLIACDFENSIKKNVNNKDNNSDTGEIALINDYSKLIAGVNCKTFENVQNKNFYKNYQKSISTTWNYFYLNQLTLISQWSVNNNITSKNDTLTVFYPFSGPDFSFMNAFFPFAENYIMVGLENLGFVPDFRNYSDLEIERYLNSLSGSMTDFFLSGYFSTKNMKDNFRSPDMNGIVHPLLFFINKTENTITDFKYFEINHFGDLVYLDYFDPLSKRIKGLHFSFTGEYGNKDLYYLQFDLSNKNFNEYPEFTTFISNFGEKNVFLKSASYLLQEDDMSNFRDILNNQTLKLLQDDSGFEYQFLLSENYNIKLFGNYSHTLNIFDDYWQKDLKKAFENKKNIPKLPFRFGYNIPFDETTLIFAKKKKKNAKKYPFYAVQFQISWEKIDMDTFPEYIKNPDFYFDEGYYKYIAGRFDNIKKAENYLKIIKNNGNKDAFIIKFDSLGRKIID